MSQAFQWTNEEVAYAAAIFDSLVDINLAEMRAGKGRKITFRCRVTSSKELCRYLAERFDGVYEDVGDKGRCHWSAGPAMLLMTRVRPYLRIKSQQTELLTNFLNLAWRNHKVDTGRRKEAFELVAAFAQTRAQIAASTADTPVESDVEGSEVDTEINPEDVIALATESGRATVECDSVGEARAIVQSVKKWLKDRKRTSEFVVTSDNVVVDVTRTNERTATA